MDFVTKLQKAFSKSVRKTTTYGTTFWVSCYVTPVLLFTAALVMTSRQYWGDPIDCVQTESAIPQNMLDQYCWIHTTFVNPRDLMPAYGETEHNKVSPALFRDVTRRGKPKDGSDRLYLTYYQWVVFALLIQTGLAAIPNMVWKAVGGEYISKWISGLDEKSLVDFVLKCELVEKEGKEVEIKDEEKVTFKTLVQRFHKEARKGKDGNFARKYLMCEWLTLFMSQIQFWFLVWFLGGHFLWYGWDFVTYDPALDARKIRKFQINYYLFKY